MFDYSQELERRIEQFAGYLRKMRHRAHEEVCGNCFIIFEDQPLPGSTDDLDFSETAIPKLELVDVISDDAGFDGITVVDDSPNDDLPDEGWREDNSQIRYIQFAFVEKYFCLDMPLQTLFRAEAEQILRSRQGFFYLRDRPEFTLKEEDVDGYDPFRKVYVYGDELSAAQDVAFIFFQVWKFPVDWRFSVKAAAFGDAETDWEDGTPID